MAAGAGSAPGVGAYAGMMVRCQLEQRSEGTFNKNHRERKRSVVAV